MNPTLRVTQRIVERSKRTRAAYLARIERRRVKRSIAHSWPAESGPRLCGLPAW
ncbi:hypothetical protein ACVXG7_20475 [Enterobacter hormaechei]